MKFNIKGNRDYVYIILRNDNFLKYYKWYILFLCYGCDDWKLSICEGCYYITKGISLFGKYCYVINLIIYLIYWVIM